MAGRYLVTGVQLGLLKSLAKRNPEYAIGVIQEILNKQHVGESSNQIEDDVFYVSSSLKMMPTILR
jgi:BioD-like phosphotransacetylase family protein